MTKTEKAHTPIPWKVSDGCNFAVVSAEHGAIASCNDQYPDHGNSNASFIVEAVNNYAKLKADNVALVEAALDARDELIRFGTKGAKFDLESNRRLENLKRVLGKVLPLP